jgi:hypothetical protein
MNAFTKKPDVSAFVKRANKGARSAVGGLNSAAKANGQCLFHGSLPQRVHDSKKAKA